MGVVRADKGETLASRLVPGLGTAFLNFDIANHMIEDGHGRLVW